MSAKSHNPSKWRSSVRTSPDLEARLKRWPAFQVPQESVARTAYLAGDDMTRAKIAISLPKHQLARVHREIRAGRADSVSGYIASVLAKHEKRDSLRTLLRDLIEQHGEPTPKDIKWAERMLPRRGRE